MKAGGECVYCVCITESGRPCFDCRDENGMIDPDNFPTNSISGEFRQFINQFIFYELLCYVVDNYFIVHSDKFYRCSILKFAVFCLSLESRIRCLKFRGLSLL